MPFFPTTGDSASSNGVTFPVPKSYLQIVGGVKIPFQFKPKGLSESNSAAYSASEIIGRSAPIQGYNNSGPRTIGVTFIFFADPKDSKIDTAKIKDYVWKLQSTLYPDHSNGAGTPPRCILKIENWLKMTGVITSWNVDVPDDTPWDLDARLPMHVEITLQIMEIRDSSISYKEVQTGAHQK